MFYCAQPRFMFTLALLALAALGCKLSERLPTTSSTPSPQPRHTTPPTSSTQAVTPAPIQPIQASPAPTPASIPERPLSTQGPWWVYSSPEGIWTLNPDGSGVTLLLDRFETEADKHLFRLAAAPAGGMVAALEVEDSPAYSPPRLSILTLPEGKLRLLAQLLPQDVDYGNMDEEALDLARDRWAAVAACNEMAWSTDGRLAFNAAFEGPSADLYVYSPAEDRLLRLTSGPTQSVGPVWSPDNQYILHGGVERLYHEYSGAGYDYAAFWAARADVSSV